MGGILGGGSNTSTSSSSPPPQVLANYQGLVNRATGVANTPYTPYPGEQVAPLSNQTLTGLSNVDQYGYAAQPYLQTAGQTIQGAINMDQQAGQMTMDAAKPVTAQQFSGDQLNQYMNPYTNDVINATQAEFNNQNQQQAQFLNSQNIGAGAFGGDRAGVSQDILAGQQQLSEAPVIAGLNQANYNQALAEFNNQQQTNLGAAEYSNSMLGQMANQFGNQLQQYANLGAAYGNVGVGAQTAGLQGANAQLQAGMIPQTEQQAIDTSLQNTWNQGQAYPFQTTGFLGNIIEGTGSQSGGTSQTTQPGPNPLNSIVGAGTAALGVAADYLPFSDARLKENITPVGKTFDGQTIHKYNFKGDPRTQIGLLAQEVEQSHPGAVRHGLGGLKHLDYDAATRESERAGFQSGGGLGGISPGNLYDLGVGKASPAGALAMTDPNSGAIAGTGAFGAGSLSRTPGGTLQHFTPPVSQWTSTLGQPLSAGWNGGEASPRNPLPAGPMAGARAPMRPVQAGPMINPRQVAAASGGRIGFQSGGTAIGGGPPQMSGFTDYGYLDTATPAAIAQGYGVPSPVSGVANMEYSALTGGASGGSNVPPNAFTPIGSESLSPSLPNLSGAAPGTVFKPIDYQNPLNNFQTAAAEKSLGPHYFTTGSDGQLVYGGEGTAPSGTSGATNQGSLLNRPGVETPTTQNTPAATVTVAAPSPQSISATTPAASNSSGMSQALLDYALQTQAANANSGYGHGGPGAGTGGGSGYADGGRIGRQDGGGLGGLPSYYTPETGNARGAHYNPAVPAPQPAPQPMYPAQHTAGRPRPPVILHHSRPQPSTPLPPPRPLTLPPVGPVRSAPSPQPIALPALNPEETRAASSTSAPYGPAGGLGDIRLPTPDDERPGYFQGGANAGVMGQMPLQGALGYSPTGQSVNGMDSQGKAAGSFGDAFGSGFRSGGRIGRQSGGGLGGLGMDPAVAALTQLLPFDPTKGVTPLQIGSTIPKPPTPSKQDSSSPDFKGLGSSIGKIAAAFLPQDNGIDSFSGSDLADISSGGPDLSNLASDAFNFGHGGAVGSNGRPGFFAGSGAGTTGGESAGPSPGAAAAAAAASGDGGDGGGGAAGYGMGVSGGLAAANLGGMTFGTNPSANNSQVSATFGDTPGPANGLEGGGGGPGGGGPGGTPGGVAGGGGAGGAQGPGGGLLGLNANQVVAQLAAQPGGLNSQQMGTPSQNVLGATLGLGSVNGQPGPLGSLGMAAPTYGVTTSPLGPSSVTPASVLANTGQTVTQAQLDKFYSQFGLTDPTLNTPTMSMGFPAGNPTIGVHGIQGTPAPAGTLGPAGNFGETTTSPGPSQGVATVANPGGGGGASPTGGPGAGISGNTQGVATALAPPGQPSVAPNSMMGMLAAPATAQALMGQLSAPSAPGLGGVATGGASNTGGFGAGIAGNAGISAGGFGNNQIQTQPVVGHGGHAYGGRTGFQDGGGLGPPPPPEPPVRAPLPAAITAPPTAPTEAPAPLSEGLGSAGKPTRQQVLDYNASIAPKYGNKPDVVSKILGGEMGAKDPYQIGDAGSSFGPWQLHKGGMNPAMNGPGMGDDYAKATGHDPNDPRYWQEQSDFAQQGMAKQGLTPWATTMGKLGLNKWSARDSAAPEGGGALAFAGSGQNQQQQQDLTHADPAVQRDAAMEDAARPPDRKLLPPHLGDALIAAGLGMMASRSSHLGVAIGEGGLEGMKYMQTQRQLDNEWRKNDAQIEDYQSQARFRDAATNLSVQNLNLERLKFLNDQRMKTWALGGGVGPPPTLLGLSDLGGGASPPAAAPTPAAQPPATAPVSAKPPPIPTTPGPLAGGPQKTVGAPPVAAPTATPPTTAPTPSKPAEAAPAPEEGAAAPDLAEDPDFVKGQTMLAEGARKNAMGKVAGIEGMGNEEIAQGQALVDGAKARWDVAKKGQEEYSGALGKSTGKAIAAIPAKMESRQVVDARLGEIQEMMGSFQPGAFAEEKADLAAKAASIFGRDFVPEKYLKDAATFQRFLKDQILNTMDSVKAMGGRPMVTEIQSLKQAMAGPEMQPGAAAAIIAQARGILKWQNDHDNAMTDWADKNPGQYNTAKFEKQFIKEHNIKDYITEAKHGFAYQGQDWHPDNPEQREVGQAYMTPKGPRVWLGGPDKKKQWGKFTPPEQ